MGTVKVDTQHVVDPYVMDADSEVELRIISVRQDVDKNGHDYIMPTFEVEGEVAAKEFSHFIGLPHDEMTAKQDNNCRARYRTFCSAIGVDPSDEQDPEDWIGLTCVAILGVKTDEQYGDQNYVKRFITGA